jgi:arylsulfatase
LADEQPAKLRELVDRWWVEAGKYNVLPLDDRGGAELLIIRRPGHEVPGNTQRYLFPSPHLERSKTPDVRNRSFSITARVARSAGDDGVLVASGARTGGYTFFVKDDRLAFTYNRLGVMHEVVASEPLPEGDLDLTVQYNKTDDHQGVATLRCAPVNDDGSATQLGSGAIETLPYRQTTYGMSLGKDSGPTVTDTYDGSFEFGGKLAWVEWTLDDDRADLAKAADVEHEVQLMEQ